MHKTFIIFLASLLATATESPAPHVVPAKVGLVLIAATRQGFALATDGSSLNADGRVSQEQRLFQAGKQGAIMIAGSVSTQDPIGKRVREEVNIGRIASRWLAAHPDADLQTADRRCRYEQIPLHARPGCRERSVQVWHPCRRSCRRQANADRNQIFPARTKRKNHAGRAYFVSRATG